MNITEIKSTKRNIWDNACQVNRTLSQRKFDKEKGINIYKNFLINQIDHPTLTSIAIQNVSELFPYYNNIDYIQNIIDLEEIPEINFLSKIVANKYQEKYKKTGYIRDVLISRNRFSYWGNTVKRKMNLFQKFAVKYIPHV